MTPTELHFATKKFASQDMRNARRQGEILIGQTTRGTVSLRHADGIYTVTTQGMNATVLAQGKRSAVWSVLAGLYSVTVQ
jgi:hypothetical protein